MSIARRLAAGAVAGTFATVAMSAVMLAARKLGLTGALPPAKITRKALALVLPRRQAERAARPVAAVAHLAYGAGGGGLFALLGRPGVLPGALFGTALWALSYLGWVPAMGLMPPAHRDRPGRQWVMFRAHLVYGAVLGKILARRAEFAGLKRPRNSASANVTACVSSPASSSLSPTTPSAPPSSSSTS